MINHLIKLRDYLFSIDKSAGMSVDRLIRKNASGPYDAPERWEMNPEDIRGVWDSGRYFKEDEFLGQTGIELSPDSGGLVSSEELRAIKALLERGNSPNSSYELVSALPMPSSGGRKSWRVFAENKTTDPMDIPTREMTEWEVWEVYPGEYGYDHGVSLPGRDTRIYGEE